jgi:S-adenosylmethionine:diacylglycerol 3-amino-3-carboxypropyl transferase
VEKRILLVGSGGCTLLSLLSVMDDNTMIDVIDNNQSQLFLIQIKIEFIKHFVNEKIGLLDFFEGRLDKNIIEDIYRNCHLLVECKEYWDNHKELLYEGINQNGVFERIFQELVVSDFNFEKVFDRNNLIDRFGEEAVIHSLNKEFYEHFKNAMRRYDNDETNYFYQQIKYNKYNIDYLPVYFSNLPKVVNNIGKINYINDNIYDYILKTNVKYDLIHTSNITDWMDISKCKIFIDNIYQKLSINGYVIMRRLNGDYELKDLITVIEMPYDKSEFYSEVVVGCKKVLNLL